MLFNQTSFKNCIQLEPQQITKVVVKNGNTGVSVETEDPAKINDFMQELNSQALKKELFGANKIGYAYFIDFYTNDSNGYLRYTTVHGFSKMDNFSKDSANGNYTEKDYDATIKIIDKFYNSLS